MTTSEFISFCDGIVTSQKFEREPSHDVKVRSVKAPLTDETLNQMAYKEILDLRTGFIYLSIIDSENEERYKECFYILERITEHFNASVPKIASWTAPVWKDVIKFVKQMPEYPRTNAFFLEELRCQERERARAAVRLREYGVVVRVEDNDLVLYNTNPLFLKINQLAESIGGINGIKLLLKSLEYKREIGRFLVPHQGNLPAMTMVELETPYGYLLNLFLRYLSAHPTSVNIRKDYELLVALTKDYCMAEYNSQKFDIWHDVFRPDNDIVNLIHELVVRFDIYNLPQSGVTFTSQWCRFLVKQIKGDDRCSPVLKQYLDSFERALKWYINQAKSSDCSMVPITRKNVTPVITSGLDSFLIADTSTINNDFKHPIDIKNVNYMMYPIYKANDCYILLPLTLGVWNWYEALYAIVKSQNTELAKYAGHFMEDFIRNKMATHSIRSHTGKYSYNGTDGEVDILVQAMDGDVIIESKKKSLSKDALKGDDFFIWGDLYAVIYSQLQCARTENGVRNFGPLTITDDKSNESFSYEWIPLISDSTAPNKDRLISKVTLTLKEYGPMQDMMLISNIMKSLSSKQINANYPEDTYPPRDIDEFEKCFTLINAALSDISIYYAAIGTKDPTFHCRFFSMEQLFHIIRKSNSNDDFLRMVAQNCVSTSTENFWNEFVNTQQIQNKQ